MSTATLYVSPSDALFRRVAWKEYRMLRGFWLAVLVLGMLMQWAMVQLSFKTTDFSGTMLLVAWGAAALYAVGAAVTLFSAESEEQTRGFLLNLPGRWLPMFAAKVAIAVISAFTLGLILCATGGLINGGTWASVARFQDLAAIGGVAVLEALAWGLLFSLWMKQPLLAAVLAMAAASFSIQVAIGLTPTIHYQTFSIKSCREAIPMRLLLTLLVFTVDVLLGMRWFQIAPSRVREKNRLANLGASLSDAVRTFTGSKGTHRSVMTRLIWQTSRESWKTMLASIPIAIFLMVAIAIPLGAFHLSGDLASPMITLLFLPALFGAFVFRADQRGDSRQFLVAHAARPRYVWLARHLFWGTGLFAIMLVVGIAIWVTFGWDMNRTLHKASVNGYGGNTYHHPPLKELWQLAFHLQQGEYFALLYTSMSWASIFTAYALGQFCSLMLRREVLAGLLALVLSVVLAAWVLATGFWQLSALWFVLPIGVGAMLATWLRMPDWVVSRNRVRTWVLPIAAVAVPLVLAVVTLPSARLSQLMAEQGHGKFMEKIRQYDAGRAAGEETALAYERFHATLSKEVGPSEDGIADLIAITQKPTCRFPFAVDLQIPNSPHKLLGDLTYVLTKDAQRLQSSGNLEAALERYLAIVRMQKHALSHQPSSTVESIQRNGIIYSGRRLPRIDKSILAWAKHSDQTSELLRKAVAGLQLRKTGAWLQSSPTINIRTAILADREQIRDVLLGKKSPIFFENGGSGRWSDYLAYLANQFSWEQQRGLRALDIRTKQILNYVEMACCRANEYWGCDADARRQLVAGEYSWDQEAPMPNRLAYGHDGNAFYRASYNALQASTSYLVTRELNIRIRVPQFLQTTLDAEVRRYGLITQLALLAYRLDHQRYPETLRELVPKYLPSLRTDPYSDAPFEYRPRGFDLPLLKWYSNRLFFDQKAEATILAQVPVFWSVGADNFKPRESSIRFTSRDENELEPEEEELVEVISLLPTDNSFYTGRSPIIFTLPKIYPEGSSPEDDQSKENDPDEIEE